MIRAEANKQRKPVARRNRRTPVTLLLEADLAYAQRNSRTSVALLLEADFGTLVKPGVLPSHEETGVLCKRNSVALIKPFESFEFVVHYASLALCLVLLTMPRH